MGVACATMMAGEGKREGERECERKGGGERNEQRLCWLGAILIKRPGEEGGGGGQDRKMRGKWERGPARVLFSACVCLTPRYGISPVHSAA